MSGDGVATTTYEARVARGFDRLARGYDRAYPDSPALEAMRREAAAEVVRVVRPGQWWLDLGCGTGRDTEALARRGARVLAADPSAGMLAELKTRVRAAGLGASVRTVRLGTRGLSRLLPRWEGRFSGVAMLFGAINYEPRPGRVPPVLWRLLAPGGRVVVAVRNRFCPWEVAYHFFVHPSLRLAFRRFHPRGADTDVGGVRVRMRVFTPGGFARLCAPWFEVERWCGLSVALPPYMAAGFPRRLPRLARWLARMEPVVSRIPFLRGLGDHFLMTLVRRDRAP